MDELRRSFSGPRWGGRGTALSGLSSSKRAFHARHAPHVSFEFFPPKTAKAKAKLETTAASLAEYNPDFISVTFGAGGSARERTLETCLGLRSSMQVDVVPHISCLGLSRRDLESHLERFQDEGIDKLLALRGDVPMGTVSAQAIETPPDGFRYANELVSFIKRFGNFQVLVACYPEGHPEAPSLQADIDNFIRKVEAGADAAVTQYFFNNAAYFHFVQELRQRGIDIPIVVGLMPLVPYQQVSSFSEKCGAEVPLWIRKRMEGYQDDPQSQLEFGVEIALQQSEELLRNGAPGIHFYTLNRSDITQRVCEHLRGQQVSYGLSWQDVAFDDDVSPFPP